MATKTFGRRGFGQVEPNHLSGIVTGQIYAQLPVNKTTMGNIIENGRFAKYDYKTGEVNLTGAGEWMLIYNEEKKYDERLQSHKDFAMIAKNYTDGVIVPRLVKTNVGDILTTNTVGASTGADSPLDGPITEKDFDVTVTLDDTKDFTIGTDGYLCQVGDSKAATGAPVWQVAKYYTMADGQPGIKLVRIS